LLIVCRGSSRSVDVSADNFDRRKNVTRHFIAFITNDDNISDIDNVRRLSVNNDIKERRISMSVDYVSVAQEYFDFLERERFGIHEKLLVESYLPDYLQNDVQIGNAVSLVKGLLMFARFNEPFILGLVLLFEQRIYCKNELIADEVPAVEGMFIIKAGSVNQVYVKERRVKQLIHGSSFFEEALIEQFDSNAYTVSS